MVEQQPTIKRVQTSELLAALNNAKSPIRFMYKRKDGTIVDSYGTRNIPYLRSLNLTKKDGSPVDLSKMMTPEGKDVALSSRGKHNISLNTRFPYYDTAAVNDNGSMGRWRSFDRLRVVGMADTEAIELIKEDYIQKGSLEANNLLANKSEFTKLLLLASEVASKVKKPNDAITIRDVILSGVSKIKEEAKKIASAPRLQGNIKFKINE